MSERPVFFTDAQEFRNWLKEHHAGESLLWLGYYKVSSGKVNMRWEESVRQALCFGWIDGLRKSIDEERYKIRFTPRRPDSHWSEKNIKMAEDLIEKGLMHPAGMEAFKNRNEQRSRRASYEQDVVELSAEYEEKIRNQPEAWEFFRDLAPGYTRTSIHWVMRAKREDTRKKRLNILIESCAEGKKIPLLRR